MRKYLFFLILLIFNFCLCFSVSADYKDNVAQGNKAYREGKLQQAIEYYNKALEENPNDQLLSFVEKLQKKTGEKNAELKTKDSAGLILVGVDILISAYAAATYLDYSASADSYEKLYASINGTTEANYRILDYEMKNIEQKGTLMAFAVSAAGIAVGYTLLDLFVLHNSFGQQVAAYIDPFNGYAVLNIKWRI